MTDQTNTITDQDPIGTLAAADAFFVSKASAGGALFQVTAEEIADFAAVAGGSGDVVGPASSTDNAVARFDSTTGKLLQNSGVTIDDSNNIATTGTVDGRDVSTDGTKLDTIETSATADQTNAEIKTAYEANSNTNAFTDADESKLDAIEAGADVTDATNVNAAGATMNTDFNANTILAANTDDTPAALTIAEQTMLGRITSGNIIGLTATQIRTLINVEDGSTADQSDAEIKTAYENNSNTNAFTDAEQTNLGNQSGTNTGDEAAASTTVAGISELATIAETDTGTDTGRTITPDALAGSYAATKTATFYETDPTADLTTGDGKAFIHIPASLNGMNLVSVHAEVITAGTTGTTDFQIHNLTQTADMLSTVLTIDSGETGSDTAAVPAVIDLANDNVATNDVIRLDIDAVSTTAPKGLIVTLEFRLP